MEGWPGLCVTARPNAAPTPPFPPPNPHPPFPTPNPHPAPTPKLQVFNILGPLINPARPRGIVAGVASRSLGQLMCEAFQLQGMRRALVVCGNQGLDEVGSKAGAW